MVEWVVWALTGTVLRLIRICPAIRAPPGISEFFKLLLQQPTSDTPTFAINFIANTR